MIRDNKLGNGRQHSNDHWPGSEHYSHMLMQALASPNDGEWDLEEFPCQGLQMVLLSSITSAMALKSRCSSYFQTQEYLDIFRTNIMSFCPSCWRKSFPSSLVASHILTSELQTWRVSLWNCRYGYLNFSLSTLTLGGGYLFPEVILEWLFLFLVH